MMFDVLTEDNVLLYAIKAYDRPNCIKSEFKDDFKRFSYLGRLFRRYKKTGELRERLILNHLVVLYNVFGVEPTTRLLFFYIRSPEYAILKTFLLFLHYMPNVVKGIRNADIYSTQISVDMTIAQTLRNLR
jgi:hypothetical protein